MASAESDLWGNASRVFGVIGGLISTIGGIYLLLTKAAGENSLIEVIAHGIGIYCLGRGLFMISSIVNFGAGIDLVVSSKEMRGAAPASAAPPSDFTAEGERR